MQADKFSLEFGTTALRVISETPALREHIESVTDWTVGSRWTVREGILLGQPSNGDAVGTASWVLYESGSVVLRRSRHEHEAVAAAVYHLAALESAVSGHSLLPLNVRTLMLPDGGVWLFDTLGAYDLPGLDRQMASRGITILPTTIALVDPATAEVLLPERTYGQAVPTGRAPIRRVLLRPPAYDRIESAQPLLSLARAVVRTADADLLHRLRQVEQTIEALGPFFEVLPHEQITVLVRSVGSAP